MQLFCQRLHEIVLCNACAVAGVVFRIKSVELFGVALQPLVAGQLHEVKAADQHIRMKPFQNIQNALVRAAADQNAAAVFLDQQIVLVAEILGCQPAVFHHIEVAASEVKRFLRGRDKSALSCFTSNAG